ncbi:hypothetical protein BDZ45DRAFT_580863, partial [Acephala macrosclerotiorum]
SNSVSVVLEDQHTLRCKSPNEDIVFKLEDPIQARILEDIEAVAEVECQLHCNAQVAIPPDGPGRRRRKKEFHPWFLNAILYGPPHFEEPVGDFLSKHQMYLQDPLGCDRRVPYRNPHILSPETGEILMTDSITYPLKDDDIERLEVGPDLLTQLMRDEIPIAETEAPDIVTTKLFSHQKQGLTFMLRREQGWQLNESSEDIWSRCSFRATNTEINFRNNVTGACQDDPPPSFQGGLLADEMGLGKTLSMISLIASSQACQYLSPPLMTSTRGSVAVKTTLLIVPPPRNHVRPGTLKVHLFHGQNRKKASFLAQYDVVITSVYTVSAIWRKQNEQNNDPDSIFSVDWHRVVLDEAHIIQNATSNLAQACCALRSANRWVITGTPIQNKLTDFASLVKFLGAYPYSEQGAFDRDISRPWRNGDQQGFLRLKAFVKAIAISRTKAVVDLPPREDYIHHLDFSERERHLYESEKKNTVRLLQDAISSSSKGSTAFNALHRLNILRLICNHGLLAQSNSDPKILGQAQGNDYRCSQDIGGLSTCSSCGSNLFEDFLEGSPSADLIEEPLITRNAPLLCEGCRIDNDVRELRQPYGTSFLESPNTPITRSPSPSTGEELPRASIECMPTKIKALVADLKQHSSNEKSVVFSYWTYTLNLVQAMLNDAGIPYTRIDGKTSLSKRSEAVRSFQATDFLRVILVSITCGGAGLDLTAASRAYLLEPHWNPMIEEQALCRVHRVGQKCKVSTIRFLMRDSFEEQVVELQRRKKMLANVTFGQDPLSESGIGLGTLQYLKSVLE